MKREEERTKKIRMSKANRRKKGQKTSSSAASRKALEKQGISASGGFICFQAFAENKVSTSYFYDGPDADLGNALRMLSKKDVQTCLKALELLVRDIFPSSSLISPSIRARMKPSARAWASSFLYSPLRS